MSLLDTLKQDHERIKEILTRIIETEDNAERGRLFKEFKMELVGHSRAEEKVLYRRMEKADEESRDDALEGFVEHEVAETLARSLETARQRTSPKWTARASVLKEVLEHHIEEEENEFFEQARKDFSEEELQRMDQEFQREKPKAIEAMGSTQQPKGAAAS